MKRQTMIGIQGGGATRKTAPARDLGLCHSEDNSNLSPKNLKAVNFVTIDDKPMRHSDVSQNLMKLIKIIRHFWCQKCRKVAFTMAEVLITLGIIGIVAAMTMPSLIGKWQKTVHINQMKRTYSIISNAFLMAQQDYGDPTEWDWGEENSKENLSRIAETYLLPYLSLDSNQRGRNSSGKEDYIVRLKDGATIVLDLDGCIDPQACNPIRINSIYLAVSHKNKNSNYWATDRDYSRDDYILKFNRDNSKGLLFFNWLNKTKREDIMNDTKYGCNKNVAKHLRYNCGQIIFLDGWQIKDDYPW